MSNSRWFWLLIRLSGKVKKNDPTSGKLNPFSLVSDRQLRRAMMKRWIKNPNKVIPQLLVGLGGSWGYFCMGALRGWSSPAIPSLNRTLDFEMSTDDFKWISSFPMLGAIVSAMVISMPMQYYGRKKTLIGHYLFYIIGFLIMGFTYFGKDKAMLYVGRYLIGWGAGSTTPVCQIYVSECASPSIRGRLGSLTASSLALGVLMTYVVGAFVEWYVLSWVCGCLPIIFLLCTIMMPESPSWLLSKGREGESRSALQFLRGTETDIEPEVNRMKEHNERMAIVMQQKTTIRDWIARPVILPLIISLGVMMFQQTTGINAIIFYTVSIFQSTGNNIDGRYATIIVGVVQLVFTAASGFLVDRYGRRILLIGSAISSSIALATLGIFFSLQRQWGDEEATKVLGWLPLVSIMAFFGTYSAGMSNVPFIIMGEMFPFRYRSILGGMSSSFNLFASFVMVRFFPDMMKGLGKDGTFYFFTGCTLVSVVFVYFLLPETKGKTLEEVEQLFSSRNSRQSKGNNVFKKNSVGVFYISNKNSPAKNENVKRQTEGLVQLNHFKSYVRID